MVSLVSLLLGSYSARKHKVKMHHRFQYAALALSTLAVSIMIYESKGLPTVHGKLGFSVYLFIIAAVISGRLFLRRTSLLGKKIRRNEHKIIVILAVLLLAFMILNGLITFVF